jgi:hypothetical protein
MNVEQLDPAQLHALAIAAKPAKKERQNLQVGTHIIDCTVRLQGELVVSGDQSVLQTKKVGTEQLLAAVLGATTKATAKRIVAAVIEHPERRAPEADSFESKLAAKLIDETSTESLVTRKGAVSGKITATEV